MPNQNHDTGIHHRKLHETIFVPLVLSLLGGYLDAYTFILKDGVFANAQTGNIVMLSISMVSGNFAVIEKYLLPILTFSLGILVSEYIKTIAGLKQGHRRIKLILVIEAALLAAIGVIAPRTNDILINCLVSFIAALQVSNFNKVMGSSIATTMITGNLRSSMENLHRYLHFRDKEAGERVINYFSIIFFFCIGASLGMIAVENTGDNSIYFCIIPLIIAYVSILVREKRHI